MTPWTRPPVQVNAPKNIQLAPEEYQSASRGGMLTLPNKQNLKTGERIYLKEHTGTMYTGREIVAEVTESSTKEFRFKKTAVLDDEQLRASNKRDEQRHPVKKNKHLGG